MATLSREQIKAALAEYVTLMKQLGDEQKAELDTLVHAIEQKNIAAIHERIRQLTIS